MIFNIYVPGTLFRKERIQIAIKITDSRRRLSFLCGNRIKSKHVIIVKMFHDIRDIAVENIAEPVNGVYLDIPVVA